MVTTQVPDPSEPEENWLPIAALVTGFVLVALVVLIGLIETAALLFLMWIMALMILTPLWVIYNLRDNE